MSRIFRDPFILCLALGLAVFVVDRWLDRGEDREIYVGASDIARLQAQWAAQSGRPARRDELEGLVEGHLREEILSREAKALGLDRGDVIIRRRLVQKLQFVTDDVALDQPVTDEELSAFLQSNQARYEEPARFSFSHVYFSADRHQDAEEKAREVASALTEGSDSNWESLGDPFLLNRSYAGRSLADVAELFGVEFSEAFPGLKAGAWSGPVASAYGYHAVRLTGQTPSRDPSLAEARANVVRDFEAERKREASAAYYQKLREAYRVTFDTEAWTPSE